MLFVAIIMQLILQKGWFKLPQKEIILAIPPYSKIFVNVISKKEITESVIPDVNPKAVKLNDSTVELKDESLTSKKTSLQNIIKIKGYSWFRDFYCVRLQINTHNFDVAKNQLNCITSVKIKIELSSNTPIQSYSPLQIKSNFDQTLDNVIYNNDIAEQFRNNPNFITSDSTGDWINYNSTYVKIRTYRRWISKNL